MTYGETLQYMYERLPMFQRIGSVAYKANLDNTIVLCKLLKNPEKKFKSVHIAGTNGKGSTSHYLASILQSAGYKVGLYTSPHLKDFRERIRINGKKIPKKNVVEFVASYKNKFEKIEPSFFEITVGLAFNYFADEKIDIAIIETGLGGRLDSTNVITPLISVITNISLDHQNLLGNTIEKITLEKAGIIKLKTPVVIGETNATTKNIFKAKAKKESATIHFSDSVYSTQNLRHLEGRKLQLKMDIYKQKKLLFKNLNTELLGFYQQKNIPTVLQTIDILRLKKFSILDKHIRAGICNVIGKTSLLGRWQILRKKPLVICDTAHNEAGIRLVLLQLSQTPHKQLHIVFGMVNDKDCSKILSLLPKNAIYYFCKASIPRALNEDELKQQAKAFKLIGNSYKSVAEAYKKALMNAMKNDLIFIGGSTFTVAEVV